MIKKIDKNHRIIETSNGYFRPQYCEGFWHRWKNYEVREATTQIGGLMMFEDASYVATFTDIGSAEKFIDMVKSQGYTYVYYKGMDTHLDGWYRTRET